MKILIWVGYQKTIFDKKTWMDEGIGGTEYCAIKLADYLDTKENDVTIAGDVKEGNWWGVQYIHYNNFKSYQGPRGLTQVNNLTVHSHYDVVIGLQYLNYFKHLEDGGITFDRSYFWIHNEDFYRWYRGSEMEDVKQYLNHPKLNKIVGVSKYHSEILRNRFKAFYDTPQQLNTYIHSIDNAICLDDYKDRVTLPKIKGRIVWTSSPDRGLEFILDNWNDWKQARPDLSLEICCPPYGVDWLKRDISGLKDVNWQGNRCPKDLKNEIDKAEYWIYVSNYNETYCISALEMLMGKVKCITNGTGNIKNIITPDRGEIVDINPDTIKNILVKDVTDKIFNEEWNSKTEQGKAWAMKQNWGNRVMEWNEMINEL
jgi:hypothetical protein